jgi:hypothetical protein
MMWVEHIEHNDIIVGAYGDDITCRQHRSGKGVRRRFALRCQGSLLPLPHWEKAGVRGPQSLNMPCRPHSAPLQREKASAYRWHRKEVTHSLAAAFA